MSGGIGSGGFGRVEVGKGGETGWAGREPWDQPHNRVSLLNNEEPIPAEKVL
jgi:hypothetical protein